MSSKLSSRTRAVLAALEQDAQHAHHYVPDGPFVQSPGAALLTLGQPQDGDKRSVCLTPADQLTLYGFQGEGPGLVMDSLVAQQIARRGAYIFLNAALDTDRQDMLVHLHREEGSLKDFRVFNPDQPDKSHTYNPLARGTASEVAERLVEALMSPMYGDEALTGEEHRQAVRSLTLLVQALRERDTVARLDQLYAVLRTSEALAALVDAPQLWEVTRQALRRHFASQLSGTGYDMPAIQAPLARLMAVLPMFVTGKLGQVVNVEDADIDMADILKTRKGLFIMLPTLGKDRLCILLGRLLMVDLTDSLVDLSAEKVNALTPPALVVTEETPILSTGHLNDAFCAARAAGVAFVAGVANVSNLNCLTEADRASLLGPDATQVFFRAPPHSSPDDLHQLGQSLAESHHAPKAALTVAQMREQPRGLGVVVRRNTVTSFTPWPTTSVGAK